MAISKKLEESSTTAMIKGFSTGQKNKMLKRNKIGTKKKIEKFWSNINESISLLEARDVLALDQKTGQMKPATVVAVVPSPKGPSMFRVSFKDSGENVLLSKEQIKFERLPVPAGKGGTAPIQTIGVGTKNADGTPKLADETDKQETHGGIEKDRVPDEEADKTKDLKVDNESNKTGKVKLKMGSQELLTAVNKRVIYLLNNDPEFAKKYHSIKAKIKSEIPEESEKAKLELRSIRASLAQKILSQSNTKTNASLGAERTKNNTTAGTVEEGRKRFLSTISKKFLDAVAPSIVSGRPPDENLELIAKNLFNQNLKNPKFIEFLMKILNGQSFPTPEAVSQFVTNVAEKSDSLLSFSKANLDAFPAQFVDKIERFANKENIPSEHDKSKAGGIGGLGSGTKKYIPPESMKDKVDPEKMKELEGAIYSRSKVGSTPVHKAAEELPLSEIGKLAKYFANNRREVDRSQAERINKSQEISNLKLPEPGKEIDKMSTIGSKIPSSIFDKSEKEKIGSEFSKQKDDFKKRSQLKLNPLFGQSEDDEPLEAGPNYSVSDKALPSSKSLWSRLVNVNANSPFTQKLVNTAAKTFGVDEEDVQEVLRALLKTDSKGNIVGLRNPDKEALDLPADESGNFLHSGDADLAQKLFFALNPERLQNVNQHSKRTGKDMQLTPAFDEFARDEAEKEINMPSLERHINKTQKREEREAAEQAKRSQDLKSQRISPEEIEKSATEEDLRRANIGRKLRQHIAGLKDPTGKLNKDYVKRFMDPKVYQHAIDTLDDVKKHELIDDDEVSAQRNVLKKHLPDLPKDPYIPPESVRTSPSTRGIDKPTGKLVKPKSPKEDYEKQPQIKDFLGLSSTDKSKDLDAADPKKALQKYEDEEKAGIPKAQRSFMANRYGSPQPGGLKHSKESPEEIKIRRLSSIFNAAKKHVAKQGSPLGVGSVLRSMKRIISQNPNFKDLESSLNRDLILKLNKGEIIPKSKKVEESIKPFHKMSLLELLIIPGKKKLTHAEIGKEKGWETQKPETKRKWEPNFEKQKKPSTKK